MCNIAGYVGEKRAAPILVEMLRAQEGFDAGYYSGIATVHEGKIYHAKLTGDAKRLCDMTEALSLPGNIGIIHGRSGPICGDDRWAHPFIGYQGGRAEIAYVANGVGGFANSRRAEYGRLADSLMEDGYDISSRQICEKNIYYKMTDGTTAHVSDVMCQLIMKHFDLGKGEVQALEDAFCEMPSEIVGLLLSRTAPDKIFYSRINQPMFAATAPHGTYLATSAIAFPGDASEAQLLPALSAGYVSCCGLFAAGYKNPPCTVAPITARARRDAYDVISKELTKEGCEVWCPIRQYNLAAGLRGIFPDADCEQTNALMYDILFSLYKDGKLKIEKKDFKTDLSGITARRFILSIEE